VKIGDHGLGRAQRDLPCGTSRVEKVCCWLQSHLTFKKRTSLGGAGGVISKGENKRALRVTVEKVIHVYKPEERCKN